MLKSGVGMPALSVMASASKHAKTRFPFIHFILLYQAFFTIPKKRIPPKPYLFPICSDCSAGHSSWFFAESAILPLQGRAHRSTPFEKKLYRSLHISCSQGVQCCGGIAESIRLWRFENPRAARLCRRRIRLMTAYSTDSRMRQAWQWRCAVGPEGCAHSSPASFLRSCAPRADLWFSHQRPFQKAV